MTDKQTTLTQPVQKNQYIMLLSAMKALQNEAFWGRKELEELAQSIFDLTELVGFLGTKTSNLATKIEEWVGVAEE